MARRNHTAGLTCLSRAPTILCAERTCARFAVPLSSLKGRDQSSIPALDLSTTTTLLGSSGKTPVELECRHSFESSLDPGAHSLDPAQGEP